MISFSLPQSLGWIATPVMRCFMLMMGLSAVAAGNPLPREVIPQAAKLTPQPDEGGRKVWHTTHFQIDHDVELRSADLQSLAQIAETTAAVLRAHPLPLFAPPIKGRPRIAIHGKDEDYLEAGGAKGSAGFYLGNLRGTPRVIIRAQSLFQPVHRDKSRLAPVNDEDLVVHELVHLCMHRANSGIPQWLAEGVAEYFASAHQGGGRFSFAAIDATVRDHLRARSNPKNPQVPLVRIAAIATLDSDEWLDYIKKLPAEKRYQAYSCALVVAHYYLHGSKERLDQLRDLLEKAPSNHRPPPFLSTEDGPAIEQQVTRYWQPKGLSLAFADE